MPDAAKPATDEQMEALRAGFAGTRTVMAPLTLIDGKAVTIASILARYDADAADVAAAVEAARDACARLAIELTAAPGQKNAKSEWRAQIGQEIAAAIRARGGSDAEG